MVSKLKYVSFNTMTAQPYSGNPTPVFVLDHLEAWPSEKSMQTLAKELNVAETTFVRKNDERTGPSYDIRWFTPLKEEQFCGHGCVGAALALADQGHLVDASAILSTRGGISISLAVSSGDALSQQPYGGPVSVTMSFPEDAVAADDAPAHVKSSFARALGIQDASILNVAMNRINDVLIEVDSSIDISAAAMTIDPEEILRASSPGTRSQIVTRAGHGGVDFFKRVFAFGTEDQATGSTYAALGPYWGARLQKETLVAQQLSERGGQATLNWDAKAKVVTVVAEGVKIGCGELLLPA